MPYYARRATYKKTATKKTKSNEKEIRTVVKRMLKKDVELKFYDTTYNAITFNSAGISATVFQNLSGMGTGGTQSLRIGDEIQCSRLDYSFLFDVPSGAFTGDSCMRMLIFRWNDNDGGSAPTAATVLQYPAVTYTPHSPLLFQSTEGKRLTVLHDSKAMVALNAQNGCFVHKGSINLKDHPIRYNGGANTANGQLYLMLMSDNLVAGGIVWTAYGVIRLLYGDA